MPSERQNDFTKKYGDRQSVSHPSEIQAPFKTNQDPTMFGNSQYLIAIPPEINAARMSRQQFTSNAAIAFLPAQHSQDAVSSETGSHWAQLIPDLVNRNDVLDSSVQALCLMQISHVKQERWLLRSSLTFYDKALQALQGALAGPAKAFRVELFAATMALATYELLQGIDTNESRGWMHHIEGASSYLNAFPELDVCSFSLQLSFHFLETICIFDALGARKPSCFSKSKWWQGTVDRFGAHGYGALLRMITSLPTLLQDCDESVSLSASVEVYDKWSALLQTAFQMETAFLDWFQTTMAQLLPYQLTVASAPQEAWNLDHANVQSNILFPNIYIARLYLLYWSSMILLYESIAELLIKIETYLGQNKIQSSNRCDPRHNACMLDHHTQLSRAFAIKVRESAHFCLQPEIGIVGKTVILLPLWIARNHLQDRGDGEARWCSALLHQLGQNNLTFGLRVRKSTSPTSPF